VATSQSPGIGGGVGKMTLLVATGEEDSDVDDCVGSLRISFVVSPSSSRRKLALGGRDVDSGGGSSVMVL